MLDPIARPGPPTRRPRARPRAWAPGVLAAGLLLVLTSCSTEGLEFRHSERLMIAHPQDQATVKLPFTLRWTVRDFPIASTRSNAASGSVGVFVDQAPIKPGEDLVSFAKKDRICKEDPRCPTKLWFEQHRVFIVQGTSAPIRSLIDTRPVNRPKQKDRHEITLVLLDEHGVRSGEATSAIEVFVDRGDAP